MKVGGVAVDTTNILFVASGAFNGLDNIVRKRKQDQVIGFGQEIKEKQTEPLDLKQITKTESDEQLKEKDLLLSEVEPEDLISFGMIPEFVGRIPVTVATDSLTEDSLVRILTEPRNALVSQYQHLFKMDNVDLQFSDDALREIAKKAKERNTGARGLKGILDEILLDPMFDVSYCDDVTAVLICSETVKGTKKAEYIKGPLEPTDLAEEEEKRKNHLG